MEITLSNIPLPLEQALRALASAEQQTIAEAIVAAAARDLGVTLPPAASNGRSPDQPAVKRDLSFLTAGPPLEAAVLQSLEEQRQIDPELWQ